MPLSHVTKVYAVVDCKVSKLLTDPAAGTATYGTSVDVPGIKTMTIAGGIKSSDLRGDNGPLDRASTLGEVTFSVTNAKVSLDVLNIILGGTTVDSGTTPSQVSTFTLAQTSTPQYFKLEGKTPTGGADTVLGDVHFVLYKCIITDFPDLGFAEEDFRETGFAGAALPLNATGNKIMDAVLNEAAVAIP